MSRKHHSRAAMLVGVVMLAFAASETIALAGPKEEATFAQADTPLFYRLSPQRKQIALQEAWVVDLITDHVRTADEIAGRMYGQIGYSTTGLWGSVMRYIPGSSALALKDSASLFTSQAATAFKETLILNDGLETRTPYWQDQIEDELARSNFPLSDPNTPEEYRTRLHKMLQTLHAAEAQAIVLFKAKWGVNYTEVHQ